MLFRSEAVGAILAEGDHAGRIVMRDGGVVVDEFAPEVAAQGVVFGSLARLADEQSALIEPILGTIVGYDEKFAAENGALWTDGLLLHVPAGVKVQLPFHAAYELAIGVGPGLGHGGAVLRQQHRVPGPAIADRADDAVEDVRDGLVRHRAHGREAREEIGRAHV